MCFAFKKSVLHHLIFTLLRNKYFFARISNGWFLFPCLTILETLLLILNTISITLPIPHVFHPRSKSNNLHSTHYEKKRRKKNFSIRDILENVLIFWYYPLYHPTSSDPGRQLNVLLRTTGPHRGGHGPNQCRHARGRKESQRNGEMLWHLCATVQ